MKKIILFGMVCFLPGMVAAADLGVDGEVWPIAEPDLTESIRAELGRAEVDGRLDVFNDRIAGQAKTALLNRPSLGLPHAKQKRSWLHDPSITVAQDIRTHTGVLIAARGTRVNPLEQVSLRQVLIFIDGEDNHQVDWAIGQSGKIILTGGNPGTLMEDRQHRFFFDQSRVLTTRFGIAAVPARVRQEGLMLRVEELPLFRNGGTDEDS